MLNDTMTCGLAGEEIRYLIPTPLLPSVRREFVTEEIIREVEGVEVEDHIIRPWSEADTVRYYEQKVRKVKSVKKRRYSRPY